MIYIISPYLSDVKETCDANNIACPIKNGKLLNSRVVWVYDTLLLNGRRITKSDKILLGKKCSLFNPGLYQMIIEGIKIRKTY